ncbi:tRNA (adenosine(37)-N6)-threonylcarbamoyltransferase complex dimerization subunit type 1 TsaB [Rhodoferax sp. AJA081-3]|uniref:tRNA (adenosine(37)-N6)-threonylcarbamoyltransferase complex dimerization subunit type 1 TsaB n=1 Tax=Rhodoferax sp. AJA081-3 TaxID=2752316 RepID=UPI001ADF5D8D|nr:tRNA (adenosine(37)-N6)-threonylcarbamoyltransferase complex dimerization subunit type 1 TsaB [Rhodoferax sp. AJA081-3]QTN26822.1 tRNA (adenosine(37)-N6)-threonylcarbamoyltransferase complex dimerization subunit type 1 TsaB [Rhodoferax sp. AJA081-3]
MNLLAFDTGTEFTSIAICCTRNGQVQQWQHAAGGGAKASTDLIPAILDLVQQAGLTLQALDAICFGSGPGSFTGLRTACSVAQGLAFGAGVPVLPVDSLLAVAEEARYTALAAHSAGVVTALLDARMEEMYCATYAFAGSQWTTLQGSALVQPEKLQRLPTGNTAPTAPWLLAGNVFAVYGERVAAEDPSGATSLRIGALPTASAMLRLAPALLAAGQAVPAEQALPSYIRDKVAKTTAERMAEKAAATLASAAGAVAAGQ